MSINTKPLPRRRAAGQHRPTRLAALFASLASLASLALLGASPAYSAPASAASSVTFGIEAAQAHQPDSRAYLSYGATPGAVISDHIALVNYSAHPLRLNLYAVDALAGADGGITFATAATTASDAGSWFTTGASRSLLVPPRQADGAAGVRIETLRLKVPVGAAPGDHVAALVASLTVENTSAGGTPVELEQRVVERAYIRVAGNLSPQLRVEHLSLSFGQPFNPFGDVDATVRYTVRNTGNVLLSATQSVAVSGLFGGSAQAPPLPAITRLLPGAQIAFITRIHHVYPGLRLSATVTLHPTVANESDVDGTMSTVRTSTSGWAWTLTGGALLVLAIIGFVLWRRYWPYEILDDDEGNDLARESGRQRVDIASDGGRS